MFSPLSSSGHVLLLSTLALFITPDRSHAVITPTGDVTPTYNGVDDPWNMTGPITIGTNQEGELLIDGGSAVVSDGGCVGNEKNGSASVTGEGSTWNNTDTLVIGNQAAGTLNIEAGGVVSGTKSYIAGAGNSHGLVNVAGSGSTWISTDLIVGVNGVGELHVLDSGVVNSDDGFIGGSGSAYGIATVSGAGSTWNSTTLTVADQGYGKLTIENGGAVVSAWGGVGDELNSRGEVVVTGPDSLWDIDDILDVGIYGRGELTIENGGQVNCFEANLGKKLYSRGEVSVSGAGARLDVSGDIYVGREGLGILKIEDGGTVNSGAGAIGSYGYLPSSVTVSGAGSVWNALGGSGRLNIGETGNGLLRITDGGVVNSIEAHIGHGEDSIGDVIVSGPGATWNIIGEFHVGFSGGFGKLTIENGGVVNNDHPNAQNNNAGMGSITVTDVGSEWNYDDKMTLLHGSELAVKNGGRVSSYGCFLDGASTVLVTGAGSLWDLNDPNHSNPSLSIDGNSEIRIEHGGHVTSEYDARIGDTSNGYVTVTGAGSVWEHAGSIYLGHGGYSTIQIESDARVSVDGNLMLINGAVNLCGGTLNLNDGQLMYGPVATEFNFTGGRLEDVSSISSDLIQDGGTFVLNRTTETEIGGDYLLHNGALELLVNSHFDQTTSIALVSATGDIDIATLATHLDFNGFGGTPAPDSYTFLVSTDGTLTGEFETCDFSDLIVLGTPNYIYEIVYSSNSVSLVISDTGIVGDLDWDGFVGLDDLDILLNRWNQTVRQGDYLSGDLDGDGYVGLSDLDAILNNWNQGTPPPPEVTSNIPEPGTEVMVALGALGLMPARRRCD